MWLYWKLTPLSILPPKTFEGWRRRGDIPADLWKREDNKPNGQVLVKKGAFTSAWIEEKKKEIKERRRAAYYLKTKGLQLKVGETQKNIKKILKEALTLTSKSPTQRRKRNRYEVMLEELECLR